MKCQIKLQLLHIIEKMGLMLTLMKIRSQWGSLWETEILAR